jgi:thiamine kinase-like enzyme
MQDQHSHATLRRILVSRGILDPAAPWQSLSGGRTNKIWKIGMGRNAIVCKLFSKNADTPFFANSALAEAETLRALTGSGLAPNFLATLNTQFGDVVLYRFVDGQTWSGDPAPIAHLLGRVHALAIPDEVQARLPSSNFPDQTSLMLAEFSRQDKADFLALKPRVQHDTAPPVSFLHGDPVPANIVVSKTGPVLIDWQCPRMGDPCDDLAVFLSPAMQLLYGSAPLTKDDANRFLDAYPIKETAARYRTHAALYHWQMAVYCRWKISRGCKDYQQPFQLELSALESAGKNSQYYADHHPA